MDTSIVFFQGGGAGAHSADALLVTSLAGHLGEGYDVEFPQMPDEDAPDYGRWRSSIAASIGKARGPLIVVGHSLGGYMVLKYLTEGRPPRAIRALCLIAPPFPGGDENWAFDGFELPDGFGEALPKDCDVFLYASPDDRIVPFAHQALFAAAIPSASVRTTSGGHQLGNHLGAVARDIVGTNGH